MIRRLIPALIGPLAILATALSAAPWLRTFTATTITVPLFGAAVLSVLVPLISVPVTRRSLVVTAAMDLVALVVFTMTAVLRNPLGFGELVDGLHHGPARLVSFALPLSSPPSLMVVPVALCWLTGAIAGELLARRPGSRAPIPVWLAGFAVAYAATARAYLDGATSNHAADTGLGAGLLATLALLRVAQTWSEREARTASSGPERRLPLRSLVAGLGVTVLAVGAGAVGLQTSTLTGRPDAVQRDPSVRQSQPVTPLAFVASLRPNTRSSSGASLFQVTLHQSASAYLSLASVDSYDGDSWSFQRDFLPSGGVIPADSDPGLTAMPTASVSQHYRIDDDALTAAPWMPYLARPQKVTGTAVSVEPISGMVVPTDRLTAGSTYDMQSSTPPTPFAQLGSTWLAATSPPPVDTQLPAALRAPLARVVTALVAETGRASTPAPAFLTSVVDDLRTNYLLSDPSAVASGTSGVGASAAPSAGRSASAAPTTAAAGVVSGGTSLATVLASILGDQRAGTPEQYATLVAVLARSLGVPARVVSGFRLPNRGGVVSPGRYEVTAAQAHTWVEIPIRGAGWVAIDPSPSRYADSAAAKTVGAQPSASPTVAPTGDALVTQANGGHAVAAKSTVPTPRTSTHLLLALGIAISLAALLVLAVGASSVHRAWRRRQRRRGGDARDQVVGAWRETLDVLGQAGLRDLSGLTGAEVTTATEARFGLESATAVAVLSTTANRALFSPSSAVALDDADIAWRAETGLRRAVRRTMPRWARLVTFVRR